MNSRPAPALDRLDHKLLALLQADSGRTLEELGDTVGLSPSAVQRRIARYRADGLLLRQVAVLDSGRLDSVVLAAVFVMLEKESVDLHRAFKDRMRAAPEVQQCYDLAGSRDYVVMVAVTGMKACREAVDRLFMTDPNIKRFDTHFVFDAVKTGLVLPTTGQSS